MHIRGEHRFRAIEDQKGKPRCGARRHEALVDRETHKGSDSREAGHDRSHHNNMYNELNFELLSVFEGALRPHPPSEAPGRSRASSSKSASNTNGAGQTPSLPKFHLRRATCEVFRRRTPPLAPR